ncbi:Do family serine endopeptidase [Hyphobacterium sp.]|uniref:Do family serine endopeptidase n=1 Tax=Hyphobacterium sp. TaxID=2004662 RepID=UPI003BAA6F5B
MLTRVRSVALIPLLAVSCVLGAPALAQSEDVPRYAEAVPSGLPLSLADLVEDVSPSVVSINARITAPTGPDGMFGPEFEGMPPQFREWFERQFPDQPQQRPEGRSLGSGFFVDAQGHVVTNNHVIENASEITVTLSNGDEYEAEIVGADPLTDLALLRVDADNVDFDFVTLDRTPDIRVGDFVIAVGNPFGLGGTATFGMVSATGRELPTNVYNNFLQVDAAINRGNSGGPTFNLDGDVVGVNSQIISRSGGNDGIGFAIPSDVAARIVDQLLQDGRVARGWLGVQIQNVTADIADSLGIESSRGAIVSSIVSGGPADRAGFERSDVVTAINGEAVESSADLTRRVAQFAAGEDVSFNVIRDEEEIVITATLGDRPGESELNTLQSVDEPDEPASVFFGMSVQPMDENSAERLGMVDMPGLMVSDVEQGSEAAEKGLRTGDVIREAGGEEVSTVEEFRSAIDAARGDGRNAILLLVQGAAGQRYVALQIERL